MKNTVLNRKYVYLFELDSVKKTDEEIIIGQKALFDEILKNGNSVVLTYNQLIDSRGFYSLCDKRNNHKNQNYDYYNCLIKLFESGYIKVSQYGDVRSITQYLLNKIDGNKRFIFSALPLKSNQKRLIALIKRSLIYSDLTEIYSYTSEGTRTPGELQDLFLEVNEKLCNGKTQITVTKSDINHEQMKKIISNLYWMLAVVLRLSALENIYLTPKELSEYSDFQFIDFLKIVVEYNVPNNKLWKKAINIIKSLNCFSCNSNDRTRYLIELKDKSINEANFNINAYYYAATIICLCYNYACEMSIRNISKHYDFNELKEKGLKSESFKNDFFLRLSQDWDNERLPKDKYLIGETNSFEEFKDDRKKLPDFQRTLRIIELLEKLDNIENPDNVKSKNKFVSYENGLEVQQKSRRRAAIKSIIQRILIYSLCVGIAFALELLMNMLQNLDVIEISISTFLYDIVHSIIKTLIFLLLTEAITSFLSSKCKWFIPLSEALGGIKTFLSDICYMYSDKISAYQNKNNCTKSTEKYNIGKSIDFIKPESITEYKKLKNNNPQKFESLNNYSIAFPSTNEELKELIRYEELYNYKFGVVYKSNYNMLLVDPIRKDNSEIYAYERVVPTNGNGAVIIPMCNNKFVLLKQSRHAIRKEQICFPRGFGEINLSAEDNAIKELTEEINAQIISDPIPIGEITPDSGLVGSSVNVFLINIKGYSVNENHEGISSINVYTEEELVSLIESGCISDGFTLASFTLYKLYKQK